MREAGIASAGDGSTENINWFLIRFNSQKLLNEFDYSSNPHDGT